MLSVPVREARCLRPSCQQGWSSQRLWGRIGSLRPAGLASAAPHPLPASLRSWPVVVHLSSPPPTPLSAPTLFSGCLATMVPSQCSPVQCSGETGYPTPAQDALQGVSHNEGEVTPSLRNAGLMRTPLPPLLPSPKSLVFLKLSLSQIFFRVPQASQVRAPGLCRVS